MSSACPLCGAIIGDRELHKALHAERLSAITPTLQPANYFTQWACDRPELGKAIIVLEQIWSEDYRVRTIKRWEYAQ